MGWRDRATPIKEEETLSTWRDRATPVTEGTAKEESFLPAPQGLEALSPEEVQQGESRVLSAGSGFSQGATFGFGDELAGAANVLFEEFLSSKPGPKTMAEAQDRIKQAYIRGRDDARRINARAKAENEAMYIAGELVGATAAGIATGGAGAGSAVVTTGVRQGAKAAAKEAIKAATSGAAVGGVQAFGTAEGSLEEQAEIAVKSAVVGGAISPVIGPALKGAAAGATKLKTSLAKTPVGSWRAQLGFSKREIEDLGEEKLADIATYAHEKGFLPGWTGKPKLEQIKKQGEKVGKELSSGRAFMSGQAATSGSLSARLAAQQSVSGIKNKLGALQAEIGQNPLDRSRLTNLNRFIKRLDEVSKPADPSIPGHGPWIDLNDIQKLKEEINQKAKFGSSTVPLNAEDAREMRRILVEAEDEIADSVVGANTGFSVKDSGVFKKQRDEYGKLVPLTDRAKESHAEILAGATNAPGDIAAGNIRNIGALVLGLGGFAAGGPLAALGGAVAGGVAASRPSRAFVNQAYLKSSAAVATRGVKFLEKFGPVLNYGATTGGKNGVIAAHGVLMNNNEEYRETYFNLIDEISAITKLKNQAAERAALGERSKPPT